MVHNPTSCEQLRNQTEALLLPTRSYVVKGESSLQPSQSYASNIASAAGSLRYDLPCIHAIGGKVNQ